MFVIHWHRVQVNVVQATEIVVQPMKEAYKSLRSTTPSTEDPNVQHTYADKLKMFRQEISTGSYLIAFRVNKFLD